MTKFKKGDVVSLQGTIKHDQGDEEKNIFVDVIGAHDTLWMKPQDMTLVQPFFEVGDAVCWGDQGSGIVHAINDGHAWIGMASGDYCTRLLSTIQRVPTEGAVDKN